MVGIRWLAAAAHTGPGSITLWVLAAGLFFVPLALSVAALSKRFPEEGGIYVWTRRGFGDWHGLAAPIGVKNCLTPLHTIQKCR